MRILVTGGAGFVGSHSIERLLEAGHAVTAFDNLSTGKPSNLARLDVPLIEGDVRDMESLDETLSEGYDAVLHLAAVVSVPLSVADPIGSHETNTRGTLNVLEAARRHGIRRVVHASSAAVYGELAPPLHEHMLLKPLSPYAAQKLQNEIDAGVYARLYGLETVSLRYFNIFGDGLQTRDFVYVGDVAQANVLALTRGLSNGIFNVGTGKTTTVLEAYQAIAQAMGVAMDPAFGPERGGDIRHSQADISSITEALGYRPETPFAEGIRKTVEWATAFHHQMSS